MLLRQRPHHLLREKAKPVMHRNKTMYETDSLTHEMFTEGDCWVLADVIRERTGWKFAFAMNLKGDKNSGWCHAAVMTPNGAILDVEGLHVQDAWMKRWVVEEVIVTDEPVDFVLLDPMWNDEFLDSGISALEIADDLIALVK